MTTHIGSLARLSASTPAGILRECMCQPVREMQEYSPISVSQNADGYWVLDFGQNISGYLRLTIDQPAGDRITVLYSEELQSDGTRNTNGMDDAYFYAEGRFQKDEIICGGQRFTYTPSFVYHGFRYVLIDGLRQRPKESEFRAVFVHQAVEELSDFACSDPLIHQLYQMGKMSTLSNLFYMVTDCPTREKQGWTNDAAASAEQMLLNYNMTPLYKKWMQDIYDAMREDGFLPGIVPTGGWGYDWGSGPISNAVLYELPYQIWRYTDDSTCLCASLPWFRRYLDYSPTETGCRRPGWLRSVRLGGSFDVLTSAHAALLYRHAAGNKILPYYSTGGKAGWRGKNPAGSGDFGPGIKRVFLPDICRTGNRPQPHTRTNGGSYADWRGNLYQFRAAEAAAEGDHSGKELASALRHAWNTISLSRAGFMPYAGGCLPHYHCPWPSWLSRVDRKRRHHHVGDVQYGKFKKPPYELLRNDVVC